MKPLLFIILGLVGIMLIWAFLVKFSDWAKNEGKKQAQREEASRKLTPKDIRKMPPKAELAYLQKEYSADFQVLRDPKERDRPIEFGRYRTITVTEVENLYKAMTGIDADFPLLEEYLHTLEKRKLPDYEPLVLNVIAHIATRVLLSDVWAEARLDLVMVVIIHLCKINRIELTYGAGELARLILRVERAIWKYYRDNNMYMDENLSEEEDGELINMAVYTFYEDFLHSCTLRNTDPNYDPEML